MKCILGVFCLALVLLVGCDPPEVVYWNAAGDQAAVIGESGLYLSKPAGELSGIVAPQVSHVAWLPDNKNLLIVQGRKLEKWSDLKAHLPQEDRARIDALATRLRGAVEGSADGKGLDALPQNAFSEEDTDQQAAAAILELMETDAALLHKKFSADQIKGLEEHPPAVTVSTVSLLDTAANPPKAGEPLLHIIGEARVTVAPSGLGAVVARDLGNCAALYVISFKSGAKPMCIAPFAGADVAWSADSKQIAFFSLTGPARNKSITQLSALNLTPDWSEDPTKIVLKAENDQEPSPISAIADLQYEPRSHLAWLREGRLIFAARDTSFPRPANTDPKSLRLFIVDPAHPSDLTTLLDEHNDLAEDDQAHVFEVNAAQTHILVPGNNGRIVVIDLKTRKFNQVIDAIEDGKLIMQPTWRGNDEICFGLSAPDTDSPRPAGIFLQKIGGEPTEISKTWPDDALARMRTRNPEQQQQPRGRAL